jgi:hypothetical protein
MEKRTKFNQPDLFFKAFGKMPFIFTSNMFYGELMRLGMPRNISSNSNLPRVFLLQNAKQFRGSSRTWIKNNDETQTLKPTAKTSQNEDLSIEQHIAFLKSKGYKILAPTTTFEEV